MIAIVRLLLVAIMTEGFAPPPPPQAVRPTILESHALSHRLQDCFASIVDPRVERTRLHQLSDILTIAILSVIAGGNGWEDMEVYGLSKQAWLSTFLALPNGIPSADTFRRVFERMNPQQFEHCFEQWVTQLVQDLGIQVIAIDGKVAKGSYDRESGSQTLHLVSAWATGHRLVLAQAKVQDKSNEITAIPALLELLDIAGCIVTLDAMGTQKTIAQQIYTAKAEYILRGCEKINWTGLIYIPVVWRYIAVQARRPVQFILTRVLSLKANHPTLFHQVETWFETTRAADNLPTAVHHTTEAGHHRTERRTVWTVPVDQLPPLHQAEEWVGLQTLVVVERTRYLWNKTTHEIQFYLTSLPAESPKIATAIRQHWGIENSLHWTLDVTFGEDDCRVRSVHAPHNLALLRRFALNALNRESTFKRSLKQKSKRAAMNDAYMLSVLAAALPVPRQELEPSCQ